MFILGYTNDYNGRHEKTVNFETQNTIIDFVAENSSMHKDFKVVRINKYEQGQLVEHEIQYNNRLDLVKKEVAK